MNESILSNREWLVNFAVDYLVGVEPDMLDRLAEELAKRLGCPVKFSREENRLHAYVGLWIGKSGPEASASYIESMRSFFEEDFWIIRTIYTLSVRWLSRVRSF